MKLQTARQGTNETPQEFEDRCRAVSQKIICKVDDPLAQCIHCENAERMPLASYVAGLTGRQVRYANPQTIEQALKIAVSVQNAEKQEKCNESFCTRFDNSVRLQFHSPSRTRQEDRKPCSTSRPTTLGARNAQTKAALRC